MHDGKSYIVIAATEVGLINFEQVMETSADTLRYSVDGAKVTIKFYTLPDASYPDSIRDIESKSGQYSQEQFLVLMQTPEWTETELLP